jgi:pilus assembly protein CpaD
MAHAQEERIIMVRSKSFIALAALGTLMAGCAEMTPEVAAKRNPTLYSVHQPVVQRTDYVLDLGSSGGLGSAESSRLHAWFDSLQLGYGDRISVDTGSGYGDSAAREDVAKVAATYGLLLRDGAPVTAGAIQPGSVRVIVSRTNASVPGCPDWSFAATSGAGISTDSNYGCATNSNLAAMIADPNDLVLGQAGASAGDAATASKAIKSYRDAEPTGKAGLKSEKVGGK